MTPPEIRPKLSPGGRSGILLLIGVIGSFFAFFSKNNESELPVKKYSYPCMGTIVNVSFFESDEVAENAAKAVHDEFKRIEKMCNLFDPESELAKLNDQAYNQPFVCSEELYSLLLKCRNAHTQTNGAFDITAKALMDMWGFYVKRKTTPSQEEITRTLKKVGLAKVVFDDTARSVKFTVEGMAFDLGGVAKGYALDCAAAGAKKAGAENFILNLGGNIVCSGKNHKGKEFFEIGIRDPQNHHATADKIRIKNSFCATSGNYERFVIIDNKHYSHIMNPLTGYPVQNVYSTTAVASSGIDSDIFSTACFILGEEFSREAVQKNIVDNIIIISRDKNNKTTLKNIKREEQK